MKYTRMLLNSSVLIGALTISCSSYGLTSEQAETCLNTMKNRAQFEYMLKKAKNILSSSALNDLEEATIQRTKTFNTCDELANELLEVTELISDIDAAISRHMSR